MIIEALQMYEYIGVSKRVDIAKGINKIPANLKEAREQVKRANAWKRK